MKKTAIVWIVVVVVLIAGGLIVSMNKSAAPSSPVGGSNSEANQPATQTPTPTPTPGAQSPESIVPLALNTMTSQTVGTYLVAGNGMALYTLNRDTAGVSNCSGQCAVAWPPYTVSGTLASSLSGGVGITGAIAVITRADGSVQVTYKGMPLYFWQSDAVPGDVTGDGVNGFFVAKP